MELKQFNMSEAAFLNSENCRSLHALMVIVFIHIAYYSALFAACSMMHLLFCSFSLTWFHKSTMIT